MRTLTCLILVWTSDSEKFECNLCLNHLLHNEVHQKAITVEFLHESSHEIPPDREFYSDYRNANYNQMNSVLTEIDWCTLMRNRSLDEKTHLFYDKINEIIANNI